MNCRLPVSQCLLKRKTTSPRWWLDAIFSSRAFQCLKIKPGNPRTHTMTKPWLILSLDIFHISTCLPWVVICQNLTFSNGLKLSSQRGAFQFNVRSNNWHQIPRNRRCMLIIETKVPIFRHQCRHQAVAHCPNTLIRNRLCCQYIGPSFNRPSRRL